MIVIDAPAAACAVTTTTTEMTMDGSPTLGPTKTLDTISHNGASFPTMVGSMTAASQQAAKRVTIANILAQLYKQKRLGRHVKDDKSFTLGSLNLPFVDRADVNKYHCALELALYVCSDEELAKLRGNDITELELNSLTKKIELKAIEKIQKLLNKKWIQGKILGIGNQVLNFKRQHGAKTYNDKQLHVCVAAATNENNDCHHHNQEGKKRGKETVPPAPRPQMKHAPTHNPYQVTKPAQPKKQQDPCKSFFSVRRHRES